MMFTHKELQGFRRMFKDTRDLTTDTDDALYWAPLREALVRETCLYYVREERQSPLKDEFLFQALLLNQLGQSNENWEFMEARIKILRKGEQIDPPRLYWQGTWAYVLATIFRGDYTRIDAIKKRFWKNI